MRVKRFIEKDMSEAMIRIKSEMGNDAVILHTRKIRQPGILGVFKNYLIEVVAAIDEDSSFEEAAKPDVAMAKAMEIREILKDMKPDDNAKAVGATSNDEARGNDVNGEIQKLSGDIEYLKGMLQTIIEEKRKERDQSSPETPTKSVEKPSGAKRNSPKGAELSKSAVIEKAESVVKSSDSPGSGDVKKYAPKSKTKLQKFLDVFEDKGVDEDFLLDLEKKLSKYKLSTKSDLKAALTDVISEIVGDPFTIEKDIEPNNVIFFLGPTGVGKTTTLAKLSARLSLMENKKVGLITADTYRIAAVEQLRTYSEILGIPLSVVYEPDELMSAIKKYKDMDYILVDTAGRSHRSDEMQRDVQSLISKVPNKEVFLVISATTGFKDVREIVSSYGFLDDYKIIVTKLDETSAPGGILNIRMLTEKKLTYFTTGQNVPDDIELANPERLIMNIMGD
jgi:flagellar biosynthesis protein FlhF